MTTRGRPPGRSSARTRQAILGAAEQIFAERGFAATRLEDVAARVGIRRASIVYYFANKRALYEAVLEAVFSDLEERVASILSGPEPLPQRIETLVEAWVEYVGRRPSFARLLLREVADGGSGREPPVRKHIQPFFELIRKQVIERPDPAHRRLSRVDPVHTASALAGGSVFFSAAIPALVPELGLDPGSPEQVAAQREQALRILPLLLGEKGPVASSEKPPRAGAKRSRTSGSPSSRAAKKSPRR